MMLLHRFCTLVILLTSIVTLITCDCPSDRQEQYHDEARLNQDLLCAYNADYQPVKDHKTAINVRVRFAIKYVSIDALDETFTIHSWVGLYWNDEFLKWLPSDYGDIKKTHIESHQIWSPKLTLYNADALMYQSEQIYSTCVVTYNGRVKCSPALTHSGICRTTLRSWPYDVQNCTLYFGSWMNTGEQINYTFTKKDAVLLDFAQDGPGWQLLQVVIQRVPNKYNCCSNNTYPMLKYTFTLKRVSAGPAAIVVVPSVVIVLLTLISLTLDVKDNLRLILVCCCLYGHFIFLTEVGYHIPKHGADTPIILLFLRDSMILTLAGIVETLFLMYLRRQVSPAPGLIVTMNRLISNGPGKYVVFTDFDTSDAVDTKVLSEDTTDTNEAKTHALIEWIKFANLLNSALFILAVLVYFVLICLYIPRDS